MNLGYLNKNKKFIPHKDYVGDLKKLCKENDIVTYCNKNLPNKGGYICTVTVARLNSTGKPKQETSELCNSERMAQCMAAEKMIQRLQAAANAKNNIAVEQKVENIVEKEDCTREEPTEKNEDHVDENETEAKKEEEKTSESEDLVFDYGNDFKQKKPTKKKPLQVDKIKLIDQTFEIQPFDQVFWRAIISPVGQSFSFDFSFRSSSCDDFFICKFSAQKPIKSIFKNITEFLEITNIHHKPGSAIAIVESVNPRNVILKLLPPHQGSLTMQSVYSDTKKKFYLNEKFALHFCLMDF